MVFLTSLLASAALVSAADVRWAASEKANQTEGLTDLAREVYQFAYPLVLMDCTRQQVTDVPDSTSVLGRAPINQFVYFRTFPTATDRDIVRFNFDTLYSFAWLDLSAGSIVLRMRQLGLNPGQRWNPAAQSDAVLAAVDSGATQALADIAEKMQNTGQRVHGWNLLNEFMGNYGVAYLHRAAIAMGGIGAVL